MLTLGQVLGGMATYVAAAVSCVIIFLTIRWIGGDALRQLESPLVRKIFRKLETDSIISVALLRVLFQTVPAVSYALAMSGVRLDIT